MPKKLTKSTTKRKAKISKDAERQDLEAVVHHRRPEFIAEKTKLKDMYRPIPGFFSDRWLEAGMTGEEFAARTRMAVGEVSRLGNGKRGMQLAQACWVSDTLSIPLDTVAEGMGVIGWKKMAISENMVPVAGFIGPDLLVHHGRSKEEHHVRAPEGNAASLVAYRFRTRGSELEHLHESILFRRAWSAATDLNGRPRLAIVVLDGEHQEKLRLVKAGGPKNADAAHDYFDLNGKAVERNRRFNQFWPVVWMKT